MIFSSTTPQHSQYALTHFRSPRCSWWAGLPSSQASPSPPPRRRQRWWWWSRRGGGRGGGTSLLSSFWRTLFSSVDKEGVSVIESCGRGSFKGGEVFIGLATGLTSQGLLSPLSYLLPGNSEKCAMPRSSGKYWVTSRSGEVQSFPGWVYTGVQMPGGTCAELYKVLLLQLDNCYSSVFSLLLSCCVSTLSFHRLWQEYLWNVFNISLFWGYGIFLPGNFHLIQCHFRELLYYISPDQSI